MNMKPRNIFILAIFVLFLAVILFNNLRTTVFNFLGIETTEAKLERLKINNEQQKQALINLEKEKKISEAKSKVELNTTVTKLKLDSKLEVDMAKLKASVKPDENETVIINRITKEAKIKLEDITPIKPKKDSKTIEHHNRDKSIKPVFIDKKEKQKIQEECKRLNRNSVIIDKKKYIIEGYKDIKAITEAYKKIDSLPVIKDTP